MRNGLDYSARRLPGDSIARDGYTFVIRYLNFPGQIFPPLTAQEVADLEGHGVEVHAVYEQREDDPAGGYNAGRLLGARAIQSATAAALPHGRTIFMCSDAWLYKHGISVSTAMAFLDGAASVFEGSPWKLGAYGFTDFVYAAQDGQHAERFWLCGAESGMRPGIHCYQWNNGRVYVDGLECDLNKMYLPLVSDSSGGGQSEKEDSDMPILAKGDTFPEVFALTSDVHDFAKRHILGDEFEALQAAGIRVTTLPQALVDRIPNVEDTFSYREFQALKTAVGALSVGGGSVDVPALVKAVADELDRRNRDGDPATGNPS